MGPTYHRTTSFLLPPLLTHFSLLPLSSLPLLPPLLQVWHRQKAELDLIGVAPISPRTCVAAHTPFAVAPSPPPSLEAASSSSPAPSSIGHPDRCRRRASSPGRRPQRGSLPDAPQAHWSTTKGESCCRLLLPPTIRHLRPLLV